MVEIIDQDFWYDRDSIIASHHRNQLKFDSCRAHKLCCSLFPIKRICIRWPRFWWASIPFDESSRTFTSWWLDEITNVKYSNGLSRRNGFELFSIKSQILSHNWVERNHKQKIGTKIHETRIEFFYTPSI